MQIFSSMRWKHIGQYNISTQITCT